MATAVQNTITRQKVSTLDVLWAFYQSQPKKIKIAFRNMIDTQDEEKKQSPILQWQADLKGIRNLKEDWDENAQPINKTAIANVNKFFILTPARYYKLFIFGERPYKFICHIIVKIAVI